MKKNNLLIAGATGLVGKTMIRVLEERNFPVGKIFLHASQNEQKRTVRFREMEIEIYPLDEADFSQVDVSLFATDKEVSLKYIPKAIEAGSYTIDNSSAYRMDKDVPLVIPEINGSLITKSNRLYANPNCSTALLALALNPLHKIFGLKKVIVSTYQAVSGSGLKGIEQLKAETQGLHVIEPAYQYQIYNNCIPQIGDFDDAGNCEEEIKIINELKKILGINDLIIAATTVRVPIMNCHSESIFAEFERSIDVERAREVLAKSENVILEDDFRNNCYPLAIYADSKNEVFVGRIRKVEGLPNALQMWIVNDNLRKGAATNAVQIAEVIRKNFF